MNQPPPIPASAPPPIPDSAGSKRYQQFARASWLSVVIACGANILIQANNPGSSSSELRIILGVLFGVLALAGIVSGVIALFGVSRYGRKGILRPALIGLGLWIGLYGLSMPVFLKARQMAALQKATPLTAVRHLPSATSLRDQELGFAFDIPEGFQPFPMSNFPKGYSHAYFKAGGPEGNFVLLVKPLGGTLPRQHLKTEDLPPGKSMTVEGFSWRGLQVDAIRLPEKSGDIDYLTFNVQIPLRKQAIQLGFGGPAEAEKQIRDTAAELLSSLEGNSNW